MAVSLIKIFAYHSYEKRQDTQIIFSFKIAYKNGKKYIAVLHGSLLFFFFFSGKFVPNVSLQSKRLQTTNDYYHLPTREF